MADRRQQLTVVPRRFEHDIQTAVYTMIRWREFGVSFKAPIALEPARARY